jgi:glucose/arabinose dehydrogenase
MRRFIILFVLLTAFMLVGCKGSQTQIPTSVPTQALMIRVSSPTSGAAPSSSPRPTVTPTLLVTATITGTVTIPTATPTFTPTPTPTPTPVTVSELPDPSGYTWQLAVAGLDKPEGLVNAGDGSGRLFIIEQAGLVRILIRKEGILLPTPFLDLTSTVSCCGEKGLLGLAFHPKYLENGYFYVDYTENVNNQLYTVISRFSVSAEDPDRADPTSEMRLLYIQQPFQNHNGGELQFGPEGYLYIGMGDGGSAGDPLENGQSLQTMLGKILRIDVDSSEPYAIPPENPFATEGGVREIWLYGLRNPWRFSFDRLTGDMYIGDVGQDAWEEIDYLPMGSPGGENLGWNYYEGSHPYRGSPPLDTTFVMPVSEYGHDLGDSVTGGYVYRGSNLPAWQGVYLYGDFSSGRVWGLLHLPDGGWQSALVFDTNANISSFGVDESGEIYLVDYQGNILILQ